MNVIERAFKHIAKSNNEKNCPTFSIHEEEHLKENSSRKLKHITHPDIQ